jgi:hypothetical protein
MTSLLSKIVSPAVLTLFLAIGLVMAVPALPSFAADKNSKDTGDESSFQVDTKKKAKYQCGTGEDAVTTSLDFGCKGTICIKQPSQPFCVGQGGKPADHNAITDMVFALIRFLTAGAGLFIIGSLVVGGIQYSIARGDPNAMVAATNRIRTVLFSLLVFIFAYAILNYLIPGFVFK